jgi:hypothetical protein
MGRPSPRTQGVEIDPETGEKTTFQKYGTQQLTYINPTTPALGVTQINTGKTFKGFTTIPVQTIKQFTGWETSTPFSQRIIGGKTGAIVRPATQPQPNGNGNGNGMTEEKCHLDDDKPFCGFTELIGGEVCECPNWFTGETTDPTAGDRGCECEACKNGTGQCDASVPQCDAWDLGCIATGGKVESTWLWIKIILLVIGIGVFLYLLRPLFSRGKPTGGFTITPA